MTMLLMQVFAKVRTRLSYLTENQIAVLLVLFLVGIIGLEYLP